MQEVSIGNTSLKAFTFQGMKNISGLSMRLICNSDVWCQRGEEDTEPHTFTSGIIALHPISDNAPSNT